jgi:hypothetical protein
MSKPVRAVLFRADAEEPEWIALDPSKMHDVLGCEMVELFAISPRLGLWFESGLANRKPTNRSLAAHYPTADYMPFLGDVLLVANNEQFVSEDASGGAVAPGGDEESDEEAEEPDEFVDLLDDDLLNLKQTLADDIEQRKQFSMWVASMQRM